MVQPTVILNIVKALIAAVFELAPVYIIVAFFCLLKSNRNVPLLKLVNICFK